MVNGAKMLLDGRQKICRLNTDTTLLLLSHVQISDILIVSKKSSSKDSTVEFQILEFVSGSCTNIYSTTGDERI